MEENEKLWAWLQPLPTVLGEQMVSTDYIDTLVYRAALATLGYELFGRWPEVTEEGKLLELLKPRIKPGTPRRCITPNGRRDGHGVYVEFDGPGKIRCAFCKEPI